MEVVVRVHVVRHVLVLLEARSPPSQDPLRLALVPSTLGGCTKSLPQRYGNFKEGGSWSWRRRMERAKQLKSRGDTHSGCANAVIREPQQLRSTAPRNVVLHLHGGTQVAGQNHACPAPNCVAGRPGSGVVRYGGLEKCGGGLVDRPGWCRWCCGQ